jgi:NAD-reducing hydrogenase large subunit
MQKITISPVTRIEGHATVTIFMGDDGKVMDTHMNVTQFRGFEKFSEGRPFYEMPLITPRICGICPVSHHLASVKACDGVAGVKPTRTAHLLRELMHMGQMIQSHSMHFFHLAGPDLLLGFDADPAIRHVGGVIQANPTLALKAVELRKYGQEIIRLLGEKRVHPRFGVPGGVNHALSAQDRETMLADIDRMIGYVQEGIAIAKDWLDKNQSVAQIFGVFKTGYMGLVHEGNALELYDGQARLIDQDGKLLAQFDPVHYLDYIGEHVEDWSYLKFPFYKKLGWPAGVYRVAPLARLNVVDKIDTALANAELKNWKALCKGPVEGSLYYHYARMIEDLYAVERVRQILEDPDILSTDIINESKGLTGEGVGVIEAPRGTLIHHYKTDERGLLTKVNLIVATGHNNYAMNKAVNLVAKHFVDGNKLTEGMLNRVEAAIRCYDPCLSCSTHAVGQMPLVIELRTPDGTLLDSVARD